MGLLWMVLSYPGNTMIVLVMTSSTSQPRAKTTRLLLCVLAVTDMCFVTVSFLENIDALWLEHGLQCRFVLVILETCRIFSTWVLVIISVERFICVFRPLQVKRCCNFKITTVTLVVVFTCVFVGNMFLHAFELLDFDTVIVFEFTFNTIFNVGIPFIIITLVTIFIIVKLQLLSWQNARQASDVRSATGLLLSANICFIITMFPWRIFMFIGITSSYNLSELSDLIPLVFYHLFHLNFVLNFYIYFAFNVHFRRDTITLLSVKQSQEGQTNDQCHVDAQTSWCSSRPNSGPCY